MLSMNGFERFLPVARHANLPDQREEYMSTKRTKAKDSFYSFKLRVPRVSVVMYSVPLHASVVNLARCSLCLCGETSSYESIGLYDALSQ